MAAGAHPMMGTALHAFEATEATHIALSCGQRVRIIEERDDGWSYGEADQTGERGIFPTSYVQPDDQDGAHAAWYTTPTFSAPVLFFIYIQICSLKICLSESV